MSTLLGFLIIRVSLHDQLFVRAAVEAAGQRGRANFLSGSVNDRSERWTHVACEQRAPPASGNKVPSIPS